MARSSHAARDTVHIGRSRFVELGVVGFCAILLALVLPGCVSQSTGKAQTEALLLTCMDYRLIDDAESYMDGRELRNRYDQIILAGASLGATTDKYPAWNKTFWEHLEVAIQLHQVRRVIVMDHRDCGAYKVVLGEDFAKSPAKETTIHAEHLKKLRGQINKEYPHLQVELLLMDLDGKVEELE